MTRAHPVSGQRRIAWLASYPRSGNTWTRLLLANFLSAAAEPVGINDIGTAMFSALYHGRPWFDSVAGISSSDCTEDEAESLRPAVVRFWAQEAKREGREETPLFCKSHEACRDTPAGEPLFPDDVTVGAVYLIRNPLDVAVSWAFYVGEEGFADSVAYLNARTSGLGGAGNHELRQRLFDWSGHVESWTGAPFPVLTVRYEDLLADTVGWLGRIASFLRLDGASDHRRLEQAVAHSAFARLQENEDREGFHKRGRYSRTPFFRSGVAGDGRRHLSAAQVRDVLAAHGATMARFGYSCRATG